MIFKYIFLSIIISISEILPISKLGHFYIFNNTFNTNIFNDLTIVKLSNLSLIICIILIFKKDILKLLKKNNLKYLKQSLILLIFPSISFILFNNFQFNIKIVGIFFVFMILLLIFSSNKKGTRQIKSITKKELIILSLLSSLYVFPGISKIGIIFSFLKFRKFDNKNIFKYSLILSLPINIITVILSIIIDFKKIQYNIVSYIFVLIITFFITYYLIKFKNIKINNLKKIVIYLTIITIITLFLI